MMEPEDRGLLEALQALAEALRQTLLFIDVYREAALDFLQRERSLEFLEVRGPEP